MPSALDLFKNLIKKATSISMPTRRPKKLEAPKEEVIVRKPSTKKTTTSASTTKKAATSKTTAKKTAAKKTTKKEEVKVAKKAEPKTKTATKKATSKTTKATKTTKTTKKAAATKTTKTTKTTKKVTSTKKEATKKKTINPVSNMVEYYDLPYRYNLTNITVLAQNPETLFVYWDISDEDRAKFIAEYGEHFFNDTYPVLIIHNLTTNQSKEIAIDDFANNWYINVENSKCKYKVELGRRPKEHQSTVTKEYMNVTDSNTIEIPNDHVLFFKNYDMIYFTNIKTGQKVGKIINLAKDQAGINAIYKEYRLDEYADTRDRFDFSNPSSHSSSHS